ncbi:MAG: thiamine diphosphokinase [Anaerolineales bacterium]
MLNQKRAVIFLNGKIPDFSAAMKVVKPADWLVAVDGGLKNMQRLGLQPDVVIGDMDSLSPEEFLKLASNGVRLIRYPSEKDETDFELALHLAVEKEGYQTIRVLGAFGGRLDQTLANIALLALPFLENCDVRLDDGYEEAFVIRARTVIEGKPGDTLSLIPMFGAVHGVVTHGLKYPLRGESLWPERTRGISNVMLNHRASVQIEQGLLLCVHIRQMSF